MELHPRKPVRCVPIRVVLGDRTPERDGLGGPRAVRGCTAPPGLCHQARFIWGE